MNFTYNCIVEIKSKELMNTQSTLKVFKSGSYEYIYIYFKLGKNLIRVNTKNKVVKNGMTTDLFYKSTVPNYQRLNSVTKELSGRVNAYLMLKLRAPFPIVHQKECEHFITNDYYKNVFDGTPYVSSKTLEPVKTVTEHYLDFFNHKSKELNNREGIKHYKSLQNALTDYTTFINKSLTLDDINSIDFILDFRNFLTQKHPDNYLTNGSLADNTIHKRITRFKTFLKYLEEKEIYSFKKAIYSYKCQKYDNDIIALSKEDIKLIMNLEIANPHWQKIIDVFICNIFLGLRFSDLMTLKEYEFHIDSDGDYTLIKENQKTGITVKIPIQKTSLDILKKHEFNLPKYTNQYFNRELHNIFIHYDLFSDIVTKKRRVLTANMDIRYHRRELITSHTCRRTFITLAISNNIPLNTLILASGHTQIATLKSYVKKVQNKELFKAIDID